MLIHILSPYATVMPREGGASSIQRPLGSSTAVSGILDRPVKPDDESGELFEIQIRSNPVIASQRVGAKRRPMTGSTKQSMLPQAVKWIASLRSQ
ncbi:hypothetical protein [Bradyrhizobium cenepequi]